MTELLREVAVAAVAWAVSSLTPLQVWPCATGMADGFPSCSAAPCFLPTNRYQFWNLSLYVSEEVAAMQLARAGGFVLHCALFVTLVCVSGGRSVSLCSIFVTLVRVRGGGF